MVLNARVEGVPFFKCIGSIFWARVLVIYIFGFDKKSLVRTTIVTTFKFKILLCFVFPKINAVV